MKTRILIIEDDRPIATVIKKNLEAANYACDIAENGTQGLDAFERTQPSLVVMDLMLPEMDGLELTRRIRRESRIPILMLTARGTEADKVLGLEIGADDYLTKPFGTQELIARVRALLRRAAPAPEDKPLQRGALVIDPTRRTVTKDRNGIEITTLEFDLLYFLAVNSGRVFSRDALMTRVWGEDRVVDVRSIDSLVSRLRRKLESDPAHPVYLQTVWGAGYRFAESSS